MFEHIQQHFQVHQDNFFYKLIFWLCKPLIWIYNFFVFLLKLLLKIKNMFCRPFLVIGKENAFLTWIFIVIIFAPLASYLPFINESTEEAYTFFLQTYTNMYALTLCLSLLAPLFAEIGLNLYVNYKMEKDAKFVGFLMFHMILSFIFICLITIYFCKKEGDNYLFNLKISYATIIYAFLLYCISKMFAFPEFFKYGTKTYSEEDDERQQAIEKKAQRVKKTNLKGKDITL